METTSPQLSVIVPAYNVERFLDKCLHSIWKQTFTDFEVILINDGSTDNTLQICREWTGRDPRFRLISQENQGLAETRNVGIRASRAPRVMFVDSDDYLEHDAIQVLMNNMRRTSADISMGCYIVEDLQGKRLKNPAQLGDVCLTTRQAYVKILFDREVKSYAWAKIYTKSLFDGIEYPKGLLLEDYLTTYLVFRRAKLVVSTSKGIYHYVQQATSIMNVGTNKITRDKAFIEGVYQRFCDAEVSGLLNKRELALFRVKTLRRMLRTFFSLEREAANEFTQTQRQNYLAYLSHVYKRKVESDDLKKIWRSTEPKKLLLTLFYWR
jgi:glycosyltransferase